MCSFIQFWDNEMVFTWLLALSNLLCFDVALEDHWLMRNRLVVMPLECDWPKQSKNRLERLSHSTKPNGAYNGIFIVIWNPWMKYQFGIWKEKISTSLMTSTEIGHWPQSESIYLCGIGGLETWSMINWSSGIDWSPFGSILCLLDKASDHSFVFCFMVNNCVAGCISYSAAKFLGTLFNIFDVLK